MALTRGFTRSICVRCAVITSRADTCLRRSRSASSTAVISHSSDARPPAPPRRAGGAGSAGHMPQRRADGSGADGCVELAVAVIPADLIVRHRCSLARWRRANATAWHQRSTGARNSVLQRRGTARAPSDLETPERRLRLEGDDEATDTGGRRPLVAASVATGCADAKPSSKAREAGQQAAEARRRNVERARSDNAHSAERARSGSARRGQTWQRGGADRQSEGGADRRFARDAADINVDTDEGAKTVSSPGTCHRRRRSWPPAGSPRQGAEGYEVRNDLVVSRSAGRRSGSRVRAWESSAWR